MIESISDHTLFASFRMAYLARMTAAEAEAAISWDGLAETPGSDVVGLGGNVPHHRTKPFALRAHLFTVLRWPTSVLPAPEIRVAATHARAARNADRGGREAAVRRYHMGRGALQTPNRRALLHQTAPRD